MKKNTLPLLLSVLFFILRSPQSLAIEPDSPQLSTKSQVQLAYKYVKNNLSQQAISLLKPKLGTLKKKGLLVLAKAYRMEKDHSQEIKILNLLLLKQPKNASILTLFGNALLKSKDTDSAVLYYRKAIKANPKYSKAYYSLLNAFESSVKKNPRFRYEQREILSDMIKVFGHKHQFYSRFCRLYSKDGFLEETVKHCKIAIKKNNKLPANYIFLGTALLELGQTSKGEKQIFSAAKRFPQSPFAQEAAGKRALTKNDYPSAKKYYSLCIKASSLKKENCLLGLAESSYELREFFLALKYYKAACQEERLFTKKFRLATANLRSAARRKWHLKFSNGLDTCR